jgi:hypothetical protein
MEAEALGSSLVLNRSVPKTPWCQIQTHSDTKFELHSNCSQLGLLSYVANY